MFTRSSHSTPGLVLKATFVNRVLITDGLHASGMEILRKADGIETVSMPDLTPDDLQKELQNFDGIIVRSKTSRFRESSSLLIFEDCVSLKNRSLSDK